MPGPDAWFLTASGRGNPSTSIDGGDSSEVAWTGGNQVEPLVDGATYFARLVDRVAELSVGDDVLILDWRGDHDELLGQRGPRLGHLLVAAADRGVAVRGLLWRSHPKVIGFHQEQQSELAKVVNQAGGELLLDARVRRAGSHHQKLVVIRYGDHRRADVAFVGGIDLCRGRRDDGAHLGDPQAEQLEEAFGERPAWHDVQAEVRGPAVTALVETFRERWNDRTPLVGVSRIARLLGGTADEAEPPAPIPPAEPAATEGRHAVQVLRTYPARRPPYPFAPAGERSIARLYARVLARARSLVYIEDQYFWSKEIAGVYESALRRSADLRLIVVVPRHPDRNGPISGPSTRVGQLAMMERLEAAGGNRVAFYDLENERGDAIYVHAKAVIVDDVLALIGSDNMNRRSWTHDSELSIAILDDEEDPRAPHEAAGDDERPRRFARDLRLRLWREHLDLSSDDGLIDPLVGFDRWRRSAAELDAWHEGGKRGPRPPGRVRGHRPEPVPAWKRTWAWPVYHAIVDPDGRPARQRRSRRF